MQIHPIEEYNSKDTMDNYHKPCKYMNQVRDDQLSLESLGIGCKNLWRHLLGYQNRYYHIYANKAN